MRLPGANIGGQLDCVGGRFHNPNPKGYALNAENAKIGSLLWREIKEGEGVVSLSYAKAGVLADDLASWKPFKVVLDGFTYDQFAGPTSPTDAESRIEWLANRPDDMPFSPLPYEQAAKVLFGMGHPIHAWDIEREKNRLQRESDGASPIRKLGGWFLDTLKDAVYRPLRTVKWAASVVALGAAVFFCADHLNNIVPAHPVVMVNEDYKGKIAPAGDMRPTQAAPDAIPEYPEFNPLVFSLDVFTPSAVFHQEESWAPRSENKSWRMSLSLLLIVASATLALCLLWLAALGLLLCLVPALAKRWESLWRWGFGVFLTAGLLAFFSAEATWWYWIEILAGWILVPLFVLSVTGVLRPRQSSGGKD